MNDEQMMIGNESHQVQIQYIMQTIQDDKGKKLLFIVPESAGDIFLATSLLQSMEQQYPDFNIYFACKPQYQELLKNNKYIHKTLNYLPVMDRPAYMEGIGDWHGLFDISIMGTMMTQRYINYWHNGLSNIAFDLKD